MRFIDMYFCKIVWMLTGICFAAAGAVMLICSSFNLNRFYDVGEVYDVLQTNIKLNGNYDIEYNAIENDHTVMSENAFKVFLVSEGQWNYIDLFFSEISSGSFDADIACYDTDNTVQYQKKVSFLEGENVIEIPNIEYYRLDIIISEQTGLSFCLKQIQFRETEPVFSETQFVRYFLVLFLGFCLIISVLIHYLNKKNSGFSWYTLVDGLQAIFLYVGTAGEKINKKFNAKKRGLMRSGIFCFLFLFMQITFVTDLNKDKTYRYLLLVCSIGMICIALLCWEKTLKHLNWKNHLVESWFLLWLMACVSEFIVQKRFAYVSYSMIFILGFLFFMWGNMEHKEVLLKDFIRGIEWSFFPNVLFCYLFRPYLPEFRYLGGAYEPGYFAMYLLFVWISFLTELDFDIKKKSVLKRDLLYIFLLGLCGDLIWKTQTISAIIPSGLVVFIFSFRLWKNRTQIKFIGMILYLSLFVIGYMVNGYCVYHIPRQLNAEIKFERDLYLDTVTEHPFMVTVKAEEEESVNRIIYKLKTSASLEEVTTGRTLFWKAYLRDMNLWGHKSNAKFWGNGHKAHNGLLAIMHRYGIFTAVPYILMLLCNIGYTWNCFRKRLFGEKYSYFILTEMLCCYLLILIENLELPFCWLYWYAMYIVMGIYFDDEKVVISDDKKYLFKFHE